MVRKEPTPNCGDQHPRLQLKVNRILQVPQPFHAVSHGLKVLGEKEMAAQLLDLFARLRSHRAEVLLVYFRPVFRLIAQ